MIHSTVTENSTELVVCQTLLMYHMGATFWMFGTLLSPKLKIVYPAFKLNAEVAVECVAKYKCNFISCLPKILVNMLDANQKLKRDVSSLFMVGTGGQHVSAELIERAKNEFNIMIFNVGFASTECGSVTNYPYVTSNYSPKDYKSCVGKPSPFVECKIVNQENFQIQPLNVDGILFVRSYNVTPGYLNDPDATRKSLDHSRWYQKHFKGYLNDEFLIINFFRFNTGDILSMDENGLLYFKGRSNDIITSTGGGT